MSEEPEPRSDADDKLQEAAARPVAPEDFYMEGALMVFTAAYHLKRGYCCNSGCRHCPYQRS